MINNGGVIEYVCHGGVGGEASVCLELRTKFEGIGGTVITQEGVASAVRTENSPGTGSGHKMFLRHAIIKKLEDYFHRSGGYLFSHIPRPLGSISKQGEDRQESYIYEWAFGTEGFPWTYLDGHGNRHGVMLDDWGKFVTSFRAAGIDMTTDITEPDDGNISKNIIHQHLSTILSGSRVNLLWKRIDFGYQSLKIDFNELERFLSERKNELIEILRNWRYRMMVLILKYLENSKNMSERDVGRLETLVADYRRSTLNHLVSRGASLDGGMASHIEDIDEAPGSSL